METILGTSVQKIEKLSQIKDAATLKKELGDYLNLFNSIQLEFDTQLEQEEIG
jgi:hypothetical protein